MRWKDILEVRPRKDSTLVVNRDEYDLEQTNYRLFGGLRVGVGHVTDTPRHVRHDPTRGQHSGHASDMEVGAFRNAIRQAWGQF